MEKLTVDFQKNSGVIKPLHGVNSGPVTQNFARDHSKEFRAAAIPFSRLHDTEGPFGGTYYVDIPNIFPDFSKHPSDPASYDFSLTDLYIKAIYDAGTEVFYRLGVTIEHQPIKKRIYPPADFHKWARICEGVIRHYNEGWANGFHFQIRYWEIWNEPDGHPDPAENHMWLGSAEDYFRLYEITSKHLKSRFPDIKIGGYASCGFYAVTREGSAREQYFLDFFEQFLQYITKEEHKAPLDFFSWHIYSQDIQEIQAFALYAQSKLNQYQLTETENILNEWNYSGLSVLNKSMPAAAMVAGTFCMLQKSPVTAGMYYDGAPARTNYCGLFTYPEFGIAKPYYAFYAFGQLYQLKQEVYSECSSPSVYVCAATDGTRYALLLSRYEVEQLSEKVSAKFDIAGFQLQGVSPEIEEADTALTEKVEDSVQEIELDFSGFPAGSYQITYSLLDDFHTLNVSKTENFTGESYQAKLALPPQTVYLIEIIPQS